MVKHTNILVGYGDEVRLDITKLKPVICWDSDKHVGTEISESNLQI